MEKVATSIKKSHLTEFFPSSHIVMDDNKKVLSKICHISSPLITSLLELWQLLPLVMSPQDTNKTTMTSATINTAPLPLPLLSDNDSIVVDNNHPTQPITPFSSATIDATPKPTGNKLMSLPFHWISMLPTLTYQNSPLDSCHGSCSLCHPPWQVLRAETIFEKF